MRYLLSRQSKEVLRQVATSKALLAFDFDGTLAPIVGDPDQARMRNSTRQLLRRLASIYPCVVISGRSRADLREKLAGAGIRHSIGNHGAEPWTGTPSVREQIGRWDAVLAKELLPLRGVRIENKEFSVTVHYRHCPTKAKAHSQILKTALSLKGVRLINGKQAISIVPKNAPDKGMALRTEQVRLRCDRALYIGDDETDEDVFSLDEGLRLLTIRVGRCLSSRAAYFIRNQCEIDELLKVLLSF
jgi:trehalose 6-phosphate phosphatase